MLMQKSPKQKRATRAFRAATGRLLFVVLFTACLLTGTIPVLAQERSIHGRITTESGSPVAGASVKIKGTNTGTTTNEKGEYTLTAPKGAVLIVSNIGFAEQQITVGDDSQI